MPDPVYSSSIFVTTEFIQYHKWPDAPVHRLYLSDLHRHLFKVRLEIEVKADDRELEYHDVLDQLIYMITDWSGHNWNITWSCEMMTKAILAWAVSKWPDRLFYQCTVSEDGENGSVARLEG